VALQDRLAFAPDHDRKRPAPVAGPEVLTEEARTKSGADAGPGKSLNSRPPSSRRAEGQAGEQRSDRFWIYQADEHDTLWGLAEKYYGQGRYYPVILEHNPGVGIYEIGRGITLTMVNDRQAVKKLLGEITERKGPRLFWYYTVVGGDTWNSIARRFYKTEDQLPQVTDLNPGLVIEPGARVKIALE
jgi:LysM repeat protein